MRLSFTPSWATAAAAKPKHVARGNGRPLTVYWVVMGGDVARAGSGWLPVPAISFSCASSPRVARVSAVCTNPKETRGVRQRSPRAGRRSRPGSDTQSLRFALLGCHPSVSM